MTDASRETALLAEFAKAVFPAVYADAINDGDREGYGSKWREVVIYNTYLFADLMLKELRYREDVLRVRARPADFATADLFHAHIAQLNAEIARLRLTAAERETLAKIARRDLSVEDSIVVRGLLERLGGET